MPRFASKGPSPWIGGVRRAETRHVFHLPIDDAHPIEMTAILSSHPADERRTPQRDKAVARRQRRQTIEARVDEDQPSACLLCDVVHVQIAGGVSDAAAAADLLRLQDQMQPPDEQGSRQPWPERQTVLAG